MNSKLVLISALLCVVAADVSEILRRPTSGNHGARVVAVRKSHQKPTNNRLQARQDDVEESLFDNAFIPATADHHQADDDHHVEEEVVPLAFQLPESHPDFQGPYHYDTPAVTADYLPPVVHDTKNPDVDYLPPLAGPRDVVDESQPAKRSTKLRIRVRNH